MGAFCAFPRARAAVASRALTPVRAALTRENATLTLAQMILTLAKVILATVSRGLTPAAPGPAGAA